MARHRRQRQTRRSPKEWAVLLTEQAESGLSPGDFCTARGLTVSSFVSARRRVPSAAGVGGAAGGEEFVALNLDPEHPPPSPVSWDIELSLGSQVVLRIRSV